MSQLSVTNTFTQGTKAKASEVDENFDDFEAVAHDLEATEMGAASVTQAKTDFSSANAGVLVWQAGPDYGGSAGRVVAVTEKSSLALSTNAAGLFSVNFDSDCLDADPGFSAAPALIGWAVESQEAATRLEGFTIWATTISDSAATIRWSRSSTGGLTVASVLITWLGLK